MTDLQVYGAVLAWARRQSGIARPEAARRLKLTDSQLGAFENGGKVTLRLSLLTSMATVYKVPYGSLFMPSPLPLDEPKQWRTFRGTPPRLSESTLLAWRHVNDAIDTFADLRAGHSNLVPDHHLPRIKRADTIEDTTSTERARLGVTLAQQRVWTDSQARDGWRAAIESLGIFVYFHKMPRRDCMGFSVFDQRGIPAICANDSGELLERQKLFTMVHEYCHLLLRLPGVSDQGKGNAVERFCNQFAAAVLVPRDALRAILPGGGPKQDWSSREIKMVANRFTVSMEVIALRIEELEMAKAGFYERKIAEWSALHLLEKRPSESHPIVTWPERAARRLGRNHANTVFGALEHGAIAYAEASDMIGLSPRYFSEVKAALR